METIEERAHNYGMKEAGGHYQGGTRGMIYEGSKQQYTEIANEQKQIDIEKACEWLRENMNIHQTSFALTNPPEPGKFINAETAFRKAMEE